MTPQDEALGVGARIVPENGRWAVFLGIGFWDAATDDNPVETVWHRIADFPTEAAAQVAAKWYQRGADRAGPHREEFGSANE